jgi:hypothetical protein
MRSSLFLPLFPFQCLFVTDGNQTRDEERDVYREGVHKKEAS